MNPDPLPKELPIGIKIKVNDSSYIALSIGQLSLGISGQFYFFDKIESVTGSYKGNGSFYPESIIWEDIPVNLIINCKWCNKTIDNGMSLCSSEKSNCESYWTALKDRMDLDFRKPEDALEYDRACVKIFVDNKKENNA